MTTPAKIKPTEIHCEGVSPRISTPLSSILRYSIKKFQIRKKIPPLCSGIFKSLFN